MPRWSHIHQWLFMDDLSITASSAHELEEAIRYTRDFDRAFGRQETVRKRQRWKRGSLNIIEHIGAAGRLEQALAVHCETRRHTGRCECAGTPLCRPSQAALVLGRASPRTGARRYHQEAMRAALRSNCNYWCSGWWWASCVHLHPHASSVLAAARLARRGGPAWSELLHDAVQKTCHHERAALAVPARPRVAGRPSDWHRLAAIGGSTRRHTEFHGSMSSRLIRCGSIQMPANTCSVSTASSSCCQVCAKVDRLQKAVTTWIPKRRRNQFNKWVASLGPVDCRNLESARGGAARSATRRRLNSQPSPRCGEVTYGPVCSTPRSSEARLTNIGGILSESSQTLPPVA